MSTRTYLCVLFSIDIHHRYVAIMGDTQQNMVETRQT